MTTDATEHGFSRLIRKAKADHSCELPKRGVTRKPRPSISVAITAKRNTTCLRRTPTVQADSVYFKGHLCFQTDWAGFDTVKPINVIIGRNNSGKSHLLDLVEALSQGRLDGRDWQYRYRGVLDEESLRGGFREGTSGGELNGNHWRDHGCHFVGAEMMWEINEDGNVREVICPTIHY